MFCLGGLVEHSTRTPNHLSGRRQSASPDKPPETGRLPLDISDGKTHPPRITIEPELIVRGSTP